MLNMLLLVFACVCFALAALGFDPKSSRINLVALGLACWVASLLF
jgi:hypothetical protein